MDRLRRARATHRGTVTRTANELTAALAGEEVDQELLQLKLLKLEEAQDEVSGLDRQLLDAMLDANQAEEEMNTEMIAMEEYRDRVREMKFRIKALLNPPPPTRPPSPAIIDGFERASAPGRKKTYKLPKVEIKKFDGQLKNWVGFWSQFQKIHDDPELHDSDKFQYLAQSMVEGSRAQKVLGSYPQSAENYEKVVQALSDRFGDKSLLTEVYVRELLRLVFSNVQQGRSESSLMAMYDDLESHLRSLETLGVTSQQSGAFLYPLVESSLPEDLIKIWQRTAESGYDDDEGKPAEERLKSLMTFLKKEVKGSERLQLVKSGIKYPSKEKPTRSQPAFKREKVPTTAGLHVGDNNKCLFCSKNHESRDCIKAQSMSPEEKKSSVQKSKCCFVCLKIGHQSKNCNVPTRCIVCGQKHTTIMCPQVGVLKSSSSNKQDTTIVETTASNLACSSPVMLKTLLVWVKGPTGQRRVRCLIDDGSQRSYIVRSVPEEVGLPLKGKAQMVHSLFGGQRTAIQHHSLFEVSVRATRGNGRLSFTAVDQTKICGDIPRMAAGEWMQELKSKGIWLSDVGRGPQEIGILLGADTIGSIVTGRVLKLANGLTAMHTKLGWTIMGPLNQGESSLAMTITSLSVLDSSVEQLWRLDAIGIHDPAEHQSKRQTEEAVKEHFLQTVYRTPEGRYGVSLPWMDGAQTISNNKVVAERRLHPMSKKLASGGHFDVYNGVFTSWLQEGIIEEVKDDVATLTHYLPHRAVIKPESASTPVRPVFDASCKTGRSPSLNDCLQKGPNLLELIPSILTRFRERKYGVIADIRKAFLMIEMAEGDRDFLRFLWWESPEMKELKIFRHKRVVFGVNCSPFLLGAVIEFHLKRVPPELTSTAAKLLKSLYVDNCVTSVDSSKEYELFKSQATAIMADAKMELRLWRSNSGEESGIGQLTSSGCGLDSSRAKVRDPSALVLGLNWNLEDDTIAVSMPEDSVELSVPLTKRKILSCAQKIFDPIGFLCPVLLFPKLLLQETWAAKTGWDQELPETMLATFKEWYDKLHHLKNVVIPRNMTGIVSCREKWQLHVFCDASQAAYATAVFLRTEDEGVVSVQLVQAKSRVAPIKKVSIPRLELLGCVIGSRLAHSVKEALEIPNVSSFFWSDSSTALAWIRRNDEWGTFVGNRVKEICHLTDPIKWFHVPGHLNPADLPSRECSALELVRSSWWEGPEWLYEPQGNWPNGDPDANEEEVLKEKKKSAGTATLVASTVIPWSLHFSNYNSNLRVIGWVLRFIRNCRCVNNKEKHLTAAEIIEAEKALMRVVQREVFPLDASVVNGIRVTKDEEGLLRVRTKLLFRADSMGFRLPILLPHRHPIVGMLIRHVHQTHGHGGVQMIMARLRENFWILQGRKAIRQVLSSCVICRRFSAKNLEVEPASLPQDRIKAAKVFEVVGVDLAGPLFLKKKEKSWIVLFTCAVYRCLHLELVRSLSTESFLEALTRFVSRRGRPNTIYSDNGTNFVGTDNAFKLLDWKKISEQCAIQKIEWKFNPPAAAWWGGFWERLVRSVKELLRRILGRATVTYDQLSTHLCEIESFINKRPLTTVTEDPEDLAPLTPSMFLHEIPCSSFAELDFMTGGGFQKAYEERKTSLDEFKQRFRNEYLSLLVQRGKEPKKEVKIGDVVLVGADNKKRWEWPIAKVTEVYPGKDGHVRVARVKTTTGFLTRPLQRLYPLEVSSGQLQSSKLEVSEKGGEEDTKSAPPAATPGLMTRRGRLVKAPVRFSD